MASDPEISENLPRENDLRVTANVVDVWFVPLDCDLPTIEELNQILSSDERERALRFHAREHQNSFIAARGILRRILSGYTSVQPGSLLIESGAKGKPRLKTETGIQFNLGHSGGRAVYAVAGDNVGVDIEIKKDVPDWKNISRRFFSPQEADELFELEPAQQMAGFFACWTRKEAYLKATGEGIAGGLSKFYAGANPKIASGAIQDNSAATWYFKDLNLEDQYASAVVTRFADAKIRAFNFEQTEDCLKFLDRRSRGGSRPQSQP